MINRPSKRDNAERQLGEVGITETQLSNHIPPISTGQCGQVLGLIRRHQPILSFVLTADYAIPEAAARVHDLRAAGWNIITTIRPVVIFRGVERRNVASYSLGTPEWTSPEFRQPDVSAQAELDLAVAGEG